MAKTVKKKIKKLGKAVKKKKSNVVKVAKKKIENLGKKVGKVTHYFTNIKVGVVKISNQLKVGDKIHIKGATSDFKQIVKSMQIEADKIQIAKKGKSIGMKVNKHVRENDTVYKI